MMRKVSYCSRSFPLKKAFRISRGAKNSAEVVTVELIEGRLMGRGEAVPYARYGESVESVLEQINAIKNDLQNGIDNVNLNTLLPAGSARNAVDCALWDLESKIKDTPVWKLLKREEPKTVKTAMTISLDKPEIMAHDVASYGKHQLIKIKLNSKSVLESVSRIRSIAPHVRIIIDANESWTAEQLKAWQSDLHEMKVDLIEQPLPAGDDNALSEFDHLIPICADESFHTSDDIKRMIGLYDCVNIKLDKTGGLTEGLECIKKASESNLIVMLGCMIASSLSMAPALLLASDASFVDLDGPFFLKEDVNPSLISTSGKLCYSSELWG